MKLDDKLKTRVKRLTFSLLPFDAWMFSSAVDQLPADAVIGGVTIDPVAMRWNMFVISEKFEVVPEGSIPPEIVVRVNGPDRKVELVMPVGPENFMSELESL